MVHLPGLEEQYFRNILEIFKNILEIFCNDGPSARVGGANWSAVAQATRRGDSSLPPSSLFQPQLVTFAATRPNKGCCQQSIVSSVDGVQCQWLRRVSCGKTSIHGARLVSSSSSTHKPTLPFPVTACGPAEDDLIWAGRGKGAALIYIYFITQRWCKL